jgi:hypothetical protein
LAVHQDQQDVIEARKAQRENPRAHARAPSDEVSPARGLFQVRGLCDVHFSVESQGSYVRAYNRCCSSARCDVSNWRELFQTAQLKTNPLDLEQRVTAAQQAIDERMRELIQENTRTSKEEREVRDAVQTLKVLRR